MQAITYQARWIVPVASPPVENGRLTVVDGSINEVGGGAHSRAGVAVDLGDAVVLPGLVNGHTHLELTHCHGRVPYPGSFVGWIRALVESNRLCAPEQYAASIAEGARQSLAAGVTAAADIAHGAHAPAVWRTAGVRGEGFLEVLGMGPRRSGAHDRSVAVGIESCRADADGGAVRLGLSPHAPYSTDSALYALAIEFCRQTGRPLTTHLAETREEVQFLLDGTGPFRELLESWGLWDGSFAPPGCSPVEYAERLGLLDAGALLAHVNYVGDADLDRLAAGRASVAYCPRTHRFFGHPPHRYPDMLARGINVCLGTDSLASNDSLSMLDELRFLAGADGRVRPARMLAMATLGGAQALGLDGELGSLESGKRADFAVIPLEHPAANDPLADLFGGTAAPSAVYVAGRCGTEQEGERV